MIEVWLTSVTVCVGRWTGACGSDAVVRVVLAGGIVKTVSVFSQVIHADEDKQVLVRPVWSAPGDEGENLGVPPMRWIGSATEQLQQVMDAHGVDGTITPGTLVDRRDDIPGLFDEYLHPRWLDLPPTARVLGKKVARYACGTRRSCSGLFFSWSPGKDVSVWWAAQPEPVRDRIEDILSSCVSDAITWWSDAVCLSRLTQARIIGTMGVGFTCYNSKARQVHLQFNVALSSRGWTTKQSWQNVHLAHANGYRGVLDRYINLLAITRLSAAFGDIISTSPVRDGVRPAVRTVPGEVTESLSARRASSALVGPLRWAQYDSHLTERRLSSSWIASETVRILQRCWPGLVDQLLVTTPTCLADAITGPGLPVDQPPNMAEIVLRNAVRLSRPDARSVLYSALTAAAQTRWSSQTALNTFLRQAVCAIVDTNKLSDYLVELLYAANWTSGPGAVHDSRSNRT